MATLLLGFTVTFKIACFSLMESEHDGGGRHSHWKTANQAVFALDLHTFIKLCQNLENFWKIEKKMTLYPVKGQLNGFKVSSNKSMLEQVLFVEKVITG